MANNKKWKKRWKKIVKEDFDYDYEFLIELILHKLHLMFDYFNGVYRDFPNPDNAHILETLQEAINYGTNYLHYDYEQESTAFLNSKKLLNKNDPTLPINLNEEDSVTYRNILLRSAKERSQDLKNFFNTIAENCEYWWD